MIFLGTGAECAAAIASVNASLGYPRQATQADLDSGLLVRVGGGVHVPLSEITLRAADAGYVDIDADGLPTSPLRRVSFANRGFGPTQRPLVGNARVLRVLNRGSQAQLEALPSVNATRATQITAGRPYAAIGDVAGAGVPPGIVTALQTHGAATVAALDADDWVEP